MFLLLPPKGIAMITNVVNVEKLPRSMETRVEKKKLVVEWLRAFLPAKKTAIATIYIMVRILALQTTVNDGQASQNIYYFGLNTVVWPMYLYNT